MDTVTGLGVIALIYVVLFFFDTFFKTCAHYPYIQFLKGTGLNIKLFQLRWSTTAFNRLFVRWGCGHTKLLELWFGAGLKCTLILLPIAVCLLLVAVVQNFLPKPHNSGTQGIVEVVIPGVNLPLSDLVYYIVALVISSIVHELGHALACVREDVHIYHVGFSVLFILPIAYVNIHSDKLNNLNPWRSLRVLCAGIWHNIVLATVALGIYSVLPFMFATCFETNGGIWVADLTKHSPLAGLKGLQKGDTILKINECVVQNEDDWIQCLLNIKQSKYGYCVNSNLVNELDESVPLKQLSNEAYDCCAQDKTESVCFEYLDNNDGILELPPHVCLPARTTVENSKYYCNIKDKSCPENLHCIHPLLPNGTQLFKIERIGNRNVIYIGHPNDFTLTVAVSPYIPKYIFNNTKVPDVVTKFFQYLVLVSFGLALVNTIPCLFMDGQYIANNLLGIGLGKYVDSPEVISLISLIVSLIGSITLIFQCIYVFVNNVFY